MTWFVSNPWPFTPDCLTPVGYTSIARMDALIDMAATAGMGPTVKVSVPHAAPVKRAAQRVATRARVHRAEP